MLYGLLLEAAEASLLREAESAAPVARRNAEDDSWLLGLEAWVPCFSSEVHLQSKQVQAIN